MASATIVLMSVLKKQILKLSAVLTYPDKIFHLGRCPGPRLSFVCRAKRPRRMGANRKAHAKAEAAAARVTALIAAWNQRQVRRMPLLLARPLAPPASLRRSGFISYELMPGSDVDLQRVVCVGSVV